MGYIRLFLIVIFSGISLFLVPMTIGFASLAFRGRFADTSYAENVQAGLLMLAVGSIPVVLLFLTLKFIPKQSR